MFQRVATTRVVVLLVCLVSITVQAAERFYDPTQKAYVFDWKPTSDESSFELIADPDYYGVASTIVNPVLIVKGWGKKAPALEIDDKTAKPGDQFRFGCESNDAGTNLVLWLNLKSEEPINVSLRPRDQ